MISLKLFMNFQIFYKKHVRIEEEASVNDKQTRMQLIIKCIKNLQSLWAGN